MHANTRNTAARRLGQFSSVDIIAAPVQDNVVVPQSSVIPHKALPPRSTVSPTRAFARGVWAMGKEVMGIPSSALSTASYARYALAIAGFVVVPLLTALTATSRLSLVEPYQFLTFVGFLTGTFVGMCVASVLVRRAWRASLSFVHHAIERGRRV